MASGFHSPLEESVLHLLLTARSTVVVVVVRALTGVRLLPAWKAAIAEQRMAVVTASTETPRLTNELAARRNELVAQLAGSIVIAHASAGGGLARQSASWTQRGLQSQDWPMGKYFYCVTLHQSGLSHRNPTQCGREPDTGVQANIRETGRQNAGDDLRFCQQRSSRRTVK